VFSTSQVAGETVSAGSGVAEDLSGDAMAVHKEYLTVHKVNLAVYLVDINFILLK